MGVTMGVVLLCGERVVAHWLGHKDWREIRKRDACERSEQVVQEAESEAAIRQ